MDIFIYSDESGVFDNIHNEIFVFGGLMFLSSKEMDDAMRLYAYAEQIVRKEEHLEDCCEAKASILSNKSKGKLFRSLNRFHKFGVVVTQRQLHKDIFAEKKSKQRYLDYAFKITVKRQFEKFIKEGKINKEESITLHFYVDEHTTATNGRYELKEALEQEFKIGTFNYNYQKYFPPIFKNLKKIHLDYCDSKVKPLIRAADIVANKIYFLATQHQIDLLSSKKKIYIIELP